MAVRTGVPKMGLVMKESVTMPGKKMNRGVNFDGGQGYGYGSPPRRGDRNQGARSTPGSGEKRSRSDKTTNPFGSPLSGGPETSSNSEAQKQFFDTMVRTFGPDWHSKPEFQKYRRR